MEQLARFHCLRDAVHKIEPCHMFVRHLRINTDHFRVIEGFDERQHVTCGRVINIPARFIRLGFQCKLQVILFIQHIITQEVHRLAGALNGSDWVFRRVGFGSLAPAPEDVNLRAKFNTEVNGVHGFLQSISADF